MLLPAIFLMGCQKLPVDLFGQLDEAYVSGGVDLFALDGADSLVLDLSVDTWVVSTAVNWQGARDEQVDVGEADLFRLYRGRNVTWVLYDDYSYERRARAVACTRWTMGPSDRS